MNKQLLMKKHPAKQLERRKKYIPSIFAKEIKGLSSPCVIVDYKTGRQIHLLSQCEKKAWYFLRFDDEVEEIYEQFSLDLEITLELAEEYGLKHPGNKSTAMTTDFFVVKKHGYAAYSVKSDCSILDNKREVEKQILENMYWELFDIEFHVIFAAELDKHLIKNIMEVVKCYNKSRIFNEYDEIRYMIAHKIIKVDLYQDGIDYEKVKESVYGK